MREFTHHPCINTERFRLKNLKKKGTFRRSRIHPPVSSGSERPGMLERYKPPEKCLVGLGHDVVVRLLCWLKPHRPKN